MDGTYNPPSASYPCPSHPLPPTYLLYTESVILVDFRKNVSKSSSLSYVVELVIKNYVAIRLLYLCCESSVHVVRHQGATVQLCLVSANQVTFKCVHIAMCSLVMSSFSRDLLITLYLQYFNSQLVLTVVFS